MDEPTSPDTGDRITPLQTALLVVRAQLGDDVALRTLILGWHPAMWRFVDRMVGDRQVTDDIVQEIWIGAVRGLPKLKDPHRFAPWLFTIARRRVMSRLRDRYRRDEVPLDGSDLAADEESERVFDRLLIHDALGALPPVEREVVVLHHLEDLEVEHIAHVLDVHVLDVPAGTVKSRLHRARGRLRTVMEGTSDDRR